MKRYLRSNSDASKKYIKSEYFDWEEDSEFDDVNDGYEFRDEVERIIKEKYPDADIYDEPSIQGDQGSDIWFITIGNKDISVEFDYNEQLWDIRDNGPIAAAKTYAQQILQEISGKKSKKNSKKDPNKLLEEFSDSLRDHVSDYVYNIFDKLNDIMIDSYGESTVQQEGIQVILNYTIFDTIESTILLCEFYAHQHNIVDMYHFDSKELMASTKGMKVSDVAKNLMRDALTQFQESGKFSWFTDDISIDDLLK